MSEIEEAKKRLDAVRKDTNYLRTGVVTNSGEEFVTNYQTELQIKKTKSKARSAVIGTILGIIVLGFLFFQVFDFIDRHYRKVDPNLNIDTSSPHYINDLYQPDGNFYQRYLKEDEKRAYLDWLDSLKRRNKKYKVNYDNFKGMTAVEIREVFSKLSTTVKIEHPELFYYDNFMMIDDEEDIYALEVVNSFNYPFKFMQDLKYRELIRIVDRFYKENHDKNDLNKIKAVYDFFEGSKINTLVGKEDKTIASSLTKKSTTCEGISLGSQILFQRLNINSRITYGYLNGNPRVFNIIRLDDGLYYFDACIIAEKGKKSQEKYQGLLLANHYDYEEYIYNIKSWELGTRYLRYS